MDFEKEVINILMAEVLPDEVIKSLFHEAEIYDVDFSGAGYFVHCRHKDLPKNESLHSQPYVGYEFNGVPEGGFVITLGNNEMMFECYTYMDEFPADFRTKEIILRR